MSKSLHDQALEHADDRTLSLTASASSKRTEAIVQEYISFLAERGWKLAPSEVTPEMNRAAWDEKNMTTSSRSNWPNGTFRAMYDAAPSPGDVAIEEAKK